MKEEIEIKEEKKKTPVNEKPPTAYYSIKGVSFAQDQLEYGQAEELLKIQALENIKGLSEDIGLTSIVVKVIESNIAGEIIGIVLHENRKNIFIRLKNKYYAKKNKVDLINPIKSMQLWEVQKVLKDFFYLNITLMLSVSGLSNISDLAKMISRQEIFSTPQEQKKEFTD